MTKMIIETMERQNHEMSASIIGGDDDVRLSVYSDTTQAALNPKDVYLRLASNVELV